MHKANYMLITIGLIVFSNVALARAGFGHGSFHGSFGASRGHGYLGGSPIPDSIALLIGLALGYLRKSITTQSMGKKLAHKPLSRVLIPGFKGEAEVSELYYQGKIDKDMKQLKRLFAHAYIALQQAWMKQDMGLAPNLSGKLISDLERSLATLRQNDLVDYIADIEFTSISLLDASKLKGDVIAIRARLSGTMVDERIPRQQLSSMSFKSHHRKAFNDIMELCYHPYSGWQATYLAV